MDEIEQTQEKDLLTLLREQSDRFFEELLEYPTFDQVKFYLSLDAKQRQVFYEYVPPQEMARLFYLVEGEVDDVEMYFTEMERAYAVNMLMNMSNDDVVDLLKRLAPDTARKYLRWLPQDAASDILTLFQYPDGTAGALMTTEYIAISATQTVEEALLDIKKQVKDAEAINYSYVVDRNDRLVGIVSLRDILSSEPNTLIPDIMSDRIVSVSATHTQDSVAQMIRDYDLVALPVLSDDDMLLGIITVDDVIDVIDEEAISDYSGLAGVMVDDLPNNIFHSAIQRLPWLVALMLLAIVTSTFISRYKDLLELHTMLSVFLTLITGTAGNAGTQSLAITVRKLAIVKEKIAPIKFVLDEMIAGLVTGSLTGLIVMIAVGILQQNFFIGFIVGLSLFVSIVVATLAGSLIPLIIVKFGIDPAVASGPFISTLSDLTSVIIYFGIAYIGLGYVG